MICALVLYNAHKRHLHQHWVLKLACALGWLLFMPNAPYIVTDIVNLQPYPQIPFWYDILLFMSSAWTGVFLGLTSLFLMQQIVKSMIGQWRSWLFALGVLALNSFGIYLGRFLRWNSWDVLFNPLELLKDIAGTVRHPFDHMETYIFSIIFTVFITAAYLMLTSMMSFQQETS